ncbi:hypothetical protein AMECASPLE_005649 [Ameca splendens]|uniref:Uncharacterized protein n=1 Tax=Ameca splendens TaxID=208324 RepID=A0ABV0Z7Z2_9TELE
MLIPVECPKIFTDHPNQLPEPPQPTLHDAKDERLYFQLLLNNRAPSPVFKEEPSHPLHETQFSCLYPWSRSVGQGPYHMTLVQDGHKDVPVNEVFCLSASSQKSFIFCLLTFTK